MAHIYIYMTDMVGVFKGPIHGPASLKGHVTDRGSEQKGIKTHSNAMVNKVDTKQKGQMEKL